MNIWDIHGEIWDTLLNIWDIPLTIWDTPHHLWDITLMQPKLKAFRLTRKASLHLQTYFFSDNQEATASFSSPWMIPARIAP